jgi:hypothetical protein
MPCRPQARDRGNLYSNHTLNSALAEETHSEAGGAPSRVRSEASAPSDGRRSCTTGFDTRWGRRRLIRAGLFLAFILANHLPQHERA